MRNGQSDMLWPFLLLEQALELSKINIAWGVAKW